MNIVEELDRISSSLRRNYSVDVTAADLSSAIIRLLGEVIPDDEAEGEKLCEWEQGIRACRCMIIGHAYVLDQCGYWFHKYCHGCGVGEYPELLNLSCGEVIALIGNITEEEYRKGKHG